MQIRPERAELLRTDRHDEANSCLSQVYKVVHKLADKSFILCRFCFTCHGHKTVASRLLMTGPVTTPSTSSIPFRLALRCDVL